LNILQNNNLLKINLKSGKLITLDFQSPTEALESVLTLQGIIDELVTITPFTIDKSVENWVEDNALNPFGGTLSISGDLLPGTTSTYNIGSPDYEWHTLYVGSQSLVIGGVTISSADGSIIVSSINLGTEVSPILLTTDGNNLLINGTSSVGSIASNLQSCKISISGTLGLSNTNNGVSFLVPFNNTLYNTSPGDFQVSESKIQIVNPGRYLVLARYSSYDMTSGTDFLRVGITSDNSSVSIGNTIEYLDIGYIGTTINGEASKGGSMVYVAVTGGEWIGVVALHAGANGGNGTQGYPVFDNTYFNQPYLEIIKLS
jgi:hypothetical protein